MEGYDPNSTRRTRQLDADFEQLLVWDGNGNEIESIPIHPGVIENPNYAGSFEYGGKFFSDHRVWEKKDAPPKRYFSHSDAADEVYVSGMAYPIKGGTLTVTCTLDRQNPFHAEGSRVLRVHAQTDSYEWTGRLPYLEIQGDVRQVGSTPDKILLGSNYGHVECIDAASGRSLWIYVFATQRDIVSYSSRGMPPYWATAKAIYKSENRKRPLSGLVTEPPLLNAAGPKIIYDPSPTNPFKELPGYLAIAWSGVFVIMGGTGAVMSARLKGKVGNRLAAILVLMTSLCAVFCYMNYGRVSIGSSLGLRLGILIALLSACTYSMIAIKRKCWITGGAILVLSIGIAVYLFPYLISI